MCKSSMAPCGLVCDECPAYIATRSNDTATLLKCGQEWGRSYGREIKAEEVMCDGCRGSGRKWLWCRDCALATCEKSSQSQSCAHCADYPCDKVDTLEDGFKERLGRIHADLKQL